MARIGTRRGRHPCLSERARPETILAMLHLRNHEQPDVPLSPADATEPLREVAVIFQGGRRQNNRVQSSDIDDHLAATPNEAAEVDIARIQNGRQRLSTDNAIGGQFKIAILIEVFDAPAWAIEDQIPIGLSCKCQFARRVTVGIDDPSFREGSPKSDRTHERAGVRENPSGPIG